MRDQIRKAEILPGILCKSTRVYGACYVLSAPDADGNVQVMIPTGNGGEALRTVGWKTLYWG